MVKSIQRGSGEDLGGTIVELDRATGRTNSGGSAEAARRREIKLALKQAMDDVATKESELKDKVGGDRALV